MFKDIADKLLSSAKSNQNANGAPLEKINGVNDQSADEIKLVEHIKTKLEQSKQTNSRISLESIYLTNQSYLLGFDGVFFDTTYRQFKNTDPKRRLSRNRFKVNKILAICQNRLARLCQSPPRYDVRPNSNSTEDKDAARLSLEVIEYILDKQRYNEKRQDRTMECMKGGSAYVQVLWDPMLGEPMVDPETKEITGYEGDIRIETLNMLEVYPDPLAKNLEDCAWIIKAKVRKLDYFKDRYPDRGDAVKEEDAWLLSSVYDMKSNALTSVGIAGASTADQMKNSAIELVYYEKRSKEYPNGRMIITANGILLEDKELPIGEYDIVKFDDIVVGGRYYAEAVITHLRPIQDQYNICRTKMADWVRKMLAGKYLAPKGHGMGQEAINTESGEVVEYNPVPNAAPPMPMQIPVIPSYMYKELETLDAELDYISSINEISRGVLPSASIPAQGMAFLQEQDQTRLGIQTSRNEIGDAKVAKCVLKYVEQYYKMPRIIKLAGDGLEYTVKDFMGEDLKGNNDVIVIEGSTIPSSKVLRRQDIMNTYQAGLLGNPQDDKVRSKVLGMMEYGDTNEIWKTEALDKAQVKRVIAAIEAGDQTTVGKNLSEFDNHPLHLTEMNDYRKSDKFQELDDDKQNLFLWVMEWHVQAITGIMNPEIPQQQMMAQHAVNMQAQGLTPAQPMAVRNTQTGSPGNPMINPQTGQPIQMDANGSPIAPPPQVVAVPNATPPINNGPGNKALMQR